MRHRLKKDRSDLLAMSFYLCQDCGAPVYIVADHCKNCGLVFKTPSRHIDNGDGTGGFYGKLAEEDIQRELEKEAEKEARRVRLENRRMETASNE